MQIKNGFDVNVCGTDRKVEVDYALGTVNVYFAEKGPCGGGSDGN